MALTLISRRIGLPGAARALAILALAAGIGVWGAVIFAPGPQDLPPAMRPGVGRFDDTAPAALLFGKNGTLKTQVTVAGLISSGTEGAAVLSVDGGPPLAWRMGQDLAPGLRLLRVDAGGIVLDQNGTQATIAIPSVPDAAGGIVVAR